MTFALKIFGCRLNRAESARFEAALSAAGLEQVPFGEAADVVIIHTCAVTATAENECLRMIRSMRTKYPSALLAVSGCAVDAAPPERLAAMGVDLALSREERETLPDRILEKLGLPRLTAPIPPRSTAHRALLKIQDGCSFFCTYCIVPHTRGQPRSVPFGQCLDEAAAFLDAGYREIVVTGCNIACYADQGRRLPELIAALSALPGMGRIRIGSLEPGMNEAALIRRMAEDPRVCDFLHLPIQSGDDAVLRRMGRHYTVDALRRTLDLACEQVPRLGLGADLITGFPGETDAAFEATRALVSAYPFSNLHVFPYSERPGTPAAGFDGVVPVAERKRRAAELIRLREEKRVAFARSFIGREVTVLIEKITPDGNAHGWTAEYLPCTCAGFSPDTLGTLRTVTVRRAEGEELQG